MLFLICSLVTFAICLSFAHTLSGSNYRMLNDYNMPHSSKSISVVFRNECKQQMERKNQQVRRHRRREWKIEGMKQREIEQYSKSNWYYELTHSHAPIYDWCTSLRALFHTHVPIKYAIYMPRTDVDLNNCLRINVFIEKYVLKLPYGVSWTESIVPLNFWCDWTGWPSRKFIM